MPRETYATTVEKWRQFLQQVTETGIDIPGAGETRAELEAMYERACQLVAERAAHEAAGQAATRELREILDKGRIKLTFLRNGVTVELGNDSEKLVAYGIRPLRKGSRRRKGPATEE
jgi:hypothetical protein